MGGKKDVRSRRWGLWENNSIFEIIWFGFTGRVKTGWCPESGKK